jgi:hypothetical protein
MRAPWERCSPDAVPAAAESPRLSTCEWIPPKREERVRIAAFRQQLNSTGVKFTGTSPKSHDRLKISPAHMRRLLAKSDSR